jgi:hypothetical protein
MAGGCQNPSCKTTEFGAICIYLSLPLSERLATGLLIVSVGYSRAYLRISTCFEIMMTKAEILIMWVIIQYVQQPRKLIFQAKWVEQDRFQTVGKDLAFFENHKK